MRCRRVILVSSAVLTAQTTIIVSASKIRGLSSLGSQSEAIQEEEQAPWFSRLWYNLHLSRPSSSDGATPKDSIVQSRCLEDPDSKGCRNLLRRQSTNLYELDATYHNSIVWAPAPAPSLSSSTSYLADFPVGALSTSTPTKDMCYGNMAKTKYRKYCNSEMPSVSLEPSEQPTGYPEGQASGDKIPAPVLLPSLPAVSTPLPSTSPSSFPPSALPSIYPTLTPSQILTLSTIPSTGLTLLGSCQGDCDSHEDCAEGLYCYQRNENEAVPGCIGGELDTSRMDYCTYVPPPTAPPGAMNSTCDYFQLKMHWQQGYQWQEEEVEREWCAACWNNECHEGDKLFLRECAWDATFFDLINVEGGVVQINVVGTNLCLERFQNAAALEICDSVNLFQHWTAPGGNCTAYPFEMVQTYNGDDNCLTTHHHPKFGEEVELYRCTAARFDTTSLWDMF